MKKARIFSILFILVALSALILVGCDKNDKASSIALKDHDPEGVIEMTVGNFDYGAYTLIVSRESGITEEIALTEEMIKEEDIFKFYKEGEHDVTVLYEKKEYVFKICVKRLTFGDIKLPQNNVFTYDGNAHTVEVEGDMPANAVVTYVGGNSFVNAGVYDVNATVTCDGYVTTRLSTTVTIERAKYDMSGVSFESKEFVYDGNEHSVEISGTLPEGVSAPTYLINEMKTSSAIDADVYTVTARFANDNPNYEAIPDMTATLTINPAEYVLDEVDLVFKNANGNLIEGSTKVYDGTGITFDLNDYSKLSNRVAVSFSVLDSSGVVISTSNQSTNIINTGVYSVVVEFVLTDGKNYNPIEPLIKEFKVVKAKYDMTNVHFDSDVIAYDGKEHSLSVSLPIDHDITAEDIRYEYYLDGVLVTDSEGNPVTSVTEAGEYKIKAIFTSPDENYEQIVDMEATLRIEQVS